MLLNGLAAPVVQVLPWTSAVVLGCIARIGAGVCLHVSLSPVSAYPQPHPYLQISSSSRTRIRVRGSTIQTAVQERHAIPREG